MGCPAGEASVRGFAYRVLYALASDARQRVKEARKAGAIALVDEALELSDRVASSAAEAASTRLAVDTRLRLAGIFNREELGGSALKVSLAISVGQLHLAALRHRGVATVGMPQQISDGPDHETLPSGVDSNEE